LISLSSSNVLGDYSLPDSLGAALVPPESRPLGRRGARRGVADLDQRTWRARRGDAPDDAADASGSDRDAGSGRRHGRRRRRHRRHRRRGRGRRDAHRVHPDALRRVALAGRR